VGQAIAGADAISSAGSESAGAFGVVDAGRGRFPKPKGLRRATGSAGVGVSRDLSRSVCCSSSSTSGFIASIVAISADDTGTGAGVGAAGALIYDVSNTAPPRTNADVRRCITPMIVTRETRA